MPPPPPKRGRSGFLSKKGSGRTFVQVDVGGNLSCAESESAKPSVQLHLKSSSTTVVQGLSSAGSHSFFVKADGRTLVFTAADAADMDGWLKCLSSFHPATTSEPAQDAKQRAEQLKEARDMLAKGVPTSEFVLAFQKAAVDGNRDAMDLFLSNGLGINAADDRGVTALHSAVLFGRTDSVNWLLQRGADLNMATKSKNTAVEVARMKNFPAIIARLEQAQKDGDAAQKNAGRAPPPSRGGGNVNPAVAAMLQGGSASYDRAEGHETRVNRATKGSTLTNSRKQQTVEQVRRMLEKSPSRKLMTATLIKAAQDDNTDAIELLLKGGADINWKDEKGVTALHQAVLYSKTDCIRFLLDHDADLNSKTTAGNTPIDVAKLIKNDELVFMLQNYTKDTSPAATAARSSLSSSNSSAGPSPTPARSAAPLQAAAATNHEELIKEAETVCRKGVSVTAKAKGMQHAAMVGDTVVLRYYMEHGVDINHQDDRGVTALHAAVLANQAECVQWQLENGARWRIETFSQNNALDVAKMKKNRPIVRILKDWVGNEKRNESEAKAKMDARIQEARKQDRIHEAQIRAQQRREKLARQRQEAEDERQQKLVDARKAFLNDEGEEPIKPKKKEKDVVEAPSDGASSLAKELHAKRAGEVDTEDMEIDAEQHMGNAAVDAHELIEDPRTKKQDMVNALVKFAAQGEIEAVKLILAAGAPVDGKDKKSNTALFAAVNKSREKMVILLLSKDADPNLADQSGVSPLALAKKKKKKKIISAIAEAMEARAAAAAAEEDLDYDEDLVLKGIDPHFTDRVLKEAVQVWKIDQFDLLNVSNSDYGVFNVNDCYLVHSGEMQGQDAQGFGGKMWHNIHIWVGKGYIGDKPPAERKRHGPRADKLTAAALKSLELKKRLGGAFMNMYVEYQDDEEKIFKAYFPGIKYTDVESTKGGFKHVKSDKKTFKGRLMRVDWTPARHAQCKPPKGIPDCAKGSVIVRVVPPSVLSFGRSPQSAFVLDTWTGIYVWYGTRAHREAKFRALSLALEVKTYRSWQDRKITDGALAIKLLPDNRPEDIAQFSKLLRLDLEKPSTRYLRRALADDRSKHFAVTAPTLFEFSRSDNGFNATVVSKEGVPLTKDVLKAKHFYVLSQDSEVYVWIGKGCHPAARHFANQMAVQLTESLPKWAQHPSFMFEGGEDPVFRSKFQGWWESTVIPCVYRPPTPYTLPPITAADAFGGKFVEFLDKEQYVLNDLVYDEDLCIYAMAGYDIHSWELVQPKDYGIFCSLLGYVIIYSTMEGEHPKHVIYFWEGHNCDRMNFLGMLATRGPRLALTIKERVGKFPSTVRILEGHEPEHFTEIVRRNAHTPFPTRLAEMQARMKAEEDAMKSDREKIIKEDKSKRAIEHVSINYDQDLEKSQGLVVTQDLNIIASDHRSFEKFKNFWEESSRAGLTYGNIASEYELIQVHASRDGRVVRAVQVECTDAVLNAWDVFILRSKNWVFMWKGKHCSEVALAHAKKTLGRFAGERALVEVDEGSEHRDFAKSMTGYDDILRPQGYSTDLYKFTPRWFELKRSTYGHLRVKEYAADTYQQDFLGGWDDPKVVVLDVTTQIFVWQGEGATSELREEAAKFAEEAAFIGEHRPNGQAPVVFEDAYAESEVFKTFFPGWRELEPPMDLAVNRDRNGCAIFLEGATRGADWPRLTGEEDEEDEEEEEEEEEGGGGGKGFWS